MYSFYILYFYDLNNDFGSNYNNSHRYVPGKRTQRENRFNYSLLPYVAILTEQQRLNVRHGSSNKHTQQQTRKYTN